MHDGGLVPRLVPCRLVLVLWLLAPAAALGGEREDAARAKAQRGMAAYNLGRYVESARLYEEAYLLVPDPALLFNLGQSCRLAGMARNALTAYRSHLRTAGEGAPLREQVTRRVEELERTVAASQAGARRPAPQPAVALIDAAPAAPPRAGPRWGLWIGVGAAVAAGLAAALLLARDPTPAPATELGTQRVFP